jgi:hypothetical protein
LSHPAAARASSCRLKFWSSVETRAYPIFISLQTFATNEAQKKQRVSAAGSSVAKGTGFATVGLMRRCRFNATFGLTPPLRGFCEDVPPATLRRPASRVRSSLILLPPALRPLLRSHVEEFAGFFDRPGFNLYVTVLEPYLSASL